MALPMPLPEPELVPLVSVWDVAAGVAMDSRSMPAVNCFGTGRKERKKL